MQKVDSFHKPKVSVVITTYNRPLMLKEAIDSVLNQTFKDFEIVILDDDSEPSTEALVREYMRSHPHIRYSRQAHQGLSINRNRFLQHVRGEYIAFLDDDDLYLEHKLEKQVAILDRDQEIGLSYAQVLITKPGKKDVLYPTFAAESFNDLLQGCVIQVSAVLVRKACFEKVGSFNPIFESCDDYEMWLRISHQFKISFFPEAIGVYRWHESNISHNLEIRYNNLLKIYQNLIRNYPLDKGVLSKLKERLSAVAYEYVSNLVEKKEYGKATKYLLLSIGTNPMIGLKINWSAHNNYIYRIVRPYAALILYSFRHLGTLFCNLSSFIRKPFIDR